MVKPRFTNFSVRLWFEWIIFLEQCGFFFSSNIWILSPRVPCGPWKYLSIILSGRYDYSGGFVTGFSSLNNDWSHDNYLINFMFWAIEPARPIQICSSVHFMEPYKAITLLLISNSWANWHIYTNENIFLGNGDIQWQKW